MKVAYYAESPADEAALTILTEAILETKTQPVEHAGLRHRGWPSVRNVLPTVLTQLHYHTDALGLVFIMDSNGSPPHLATHANTPDPKCRLCELTRIASEARAKLRPRVRLPPLRLAIGLAVPAIEAWLLCGHDPHVTEAAWINGQKNGVMPYSKLELKKRVYRTSHPSLGLETECMKQAATRLAADISILERLFPQGFGALQKDLLAW